MGLTVKHITTFFCVNVTVYSVTNYELTDR